MNKIENNKLNSQRETDSLLTKNVVKFIMAVFAVLKARLVDSIAKTDELASRHDECKKMSRAPKAASRAALIKFILKTTSQLRALAKTDDDIDLVELVTITPSALRKMNDNALIRFAENVLKYTEDNLADLAEFGVTALTVTNGKALVAAYKLEVDKLAANKKLAKLLTAEIRIQLKVTEAILKRIDTLVETQSEDDPAWSRLYFDTRTPRRTASSRVSASGKVFDSVTNTPLLGAILTVLNAVDGKALTSEADLITTLKIKSAGGGFRLKSLSTGAYIFRVSFAGYNDADVLGYVNEGYITRLDLPMNKIE